MAPGNGAISPAAKPHRRSIGIPTSVLVAARIRRRLIVSLRAVRNVNGLSEYFFPGTVVLILLFTSIFSTISIIEDRKEGFLQSVLVAPIPRSAFVLGKLLGGTTLAVMQGVLFMLLAPLVHIPFYAIPAALGMLALVAFGLTALGYIIAWKMDSTQGFHAIMNLVLIPMWLLSGSVFPASGAPGWLRWVILVNPLTYGLAAVRSSIYGVQRAAAMNLPSFSVSLPFPRIRCRVFALQFF